MTLPVRNTVREQQGEHRRREDFGVRIAFRDPLFRQFCDRIVFWCIRVKSNPFFFVLAADAGPNAEK